MTSVATTDAAADQGPAPVGATELGRISISDTVVRKIAAKAAAENPDVGAPATRLLGVPLPGVAGVVGHDSDLDGLPKTSVEVDGTLAFIEMEISIRWPKSVAAVTGSVRSHVRERLCELTGLEAVEIRLTVADLVTDIPAPPRVR
jgi:uncharacterized alkaline shock family protein YloU